MAFVQTSAKWLNFTNCAGTQTLIRLYYQSYLERRSWREKKFCMCEGVSCSLFWGRSFSASVEWCGAKKYPKNICFCILTVLWLRPAQTLAWFDVVTCCTLFCRGLSAGFNQCHVCDQWEPCTSCLSYTLCACLTKVKNSCSLPVNCNVSFKWFLLKRLWGQPRAARMSVNSMVVSQGGYWESTGTSLLLVFTEWYAGHPFSILQKINMQGIYWGFHQHVMNLGVMWTH